MILEAIQNPIFPIVSKVAYNLGVEVFLVGGFVRDILLGRSSKDIDFVVIGDGTNFAEAVSKAIPDKVSLTVFKNYGTANIKWQNFEFEFVGARKESYSPNSRNPRVESGSLEDDLSRRDFTINALAIKMEMNKHMQITDLFNGLQDIEQKILKTPLDPDVTFSDDPLRMLRGIRFASQLNYSLHPITFDAIKRNAKRIEIISQERITDELNKIILSPIPSIGFKLLEETGLLSIIFKELTDLKGVRTVENRSHKDNFYHTLQVLDNIAQHTQDLWLRWAAILHDIGKPATQRYDEQAGWTFHGHEVVGTKMVSRIFRKLKLPMDGKMKYVEKLVLLHLRPIALTNDEVSDSAIRRLLVDVEEDLDSLMELCRADITSKNMVKVQRYLARFDGVIQKIKDVEERDALRNWKNPIDGQIIMDTFNLQPSKAIGLIKEEIKEAIIEGKILNNYQDAYNYMLSIAPKYIG